VHAGIPPDWWGEARQRVARRREYHGVLPASYWCSAVRERTLSVRSRRHLALTSDCKALLILR